MLLLFQLCASEDVQYNGEQYPIRRAVGQNFYFYECLFDLKGDTTEGSALVLTDGNDQYKVKMESTIFNRCTSKQGGSMYLSGNYIADLKRVCISDCSASESGGIMTSLLSNIYISYLSAVNCISQEKCLEIQGNPMLSNLNLSKCTVNKPNSFGYNYAYGILYIYQNSMSFQLQLSSFINNTSPCGIFYSRKSSANSYVSKCIFYKNTYSNYALFYVDDSSSKVINVASSIFLSNTPINCDYIVDADSSIINLADGNNFFDSIGFHGSVTTSSGYTYSQYTETYPIIYYGTANCDAELPYPLKSPTFMDTPYNTPYITLDVTPYETPINTPFSTAFMTPFSTEQQTEQMTPYSTPFSTAASTELQTPFETNQITPAETFIQTPYETPISTAILTESETPFETFAITPLETFSITPFETFSITSFETFAITPLETFSITPFETFSITPFETFSITPFETFSVTPFETNHFTPAETFVQTPFSTAHQTPSSSPVGQKDRTAFETPGSTFYMTPMQTEKIDVPKNPHQENTPSGDQHQTPKVKNYPDDQLNSKKDKKIKSWVWAVIAVAVVILIAAIAIIIILFVRRSKDDESEEMSGVSDEEVTNVISTGTVKSNQLAVTIDNPLFSTSVQESDDIFRMTTQDSVNTIDMDY